MKITNIEVIPIYPRLAKRYDNRKVDLYGIDHRTVFKVETDAGIVGYGDQRVRPGGQPDQQLQPLSSVATRLTLSTMISPTAPP